MLKSSLWESPVPKLRQGLWLALRGAPCLEGDAMKPSRAPALSLLHRLYPRAQRGSSRGHQQATAESRRLRLAVSMGWPWVASGSNH